MRPDKHCVSSTKTKFTMLHERYSWDDKIRARLARTKILWSDVGFCGESPVTASACPT